LPETTFRDSLQIVLLLGGAIAYAWFYQERFSEDPSSSPVHDRSLPGLSKKAERLRWQWANVAILIVLAEIAFGPVRSWGTPVALLIVTASYLSGPRIRTRFGGEIDLTSQQQTTRRRWAILPAVFVLFKGTDFQTEWMHPAILVLAGTVFAVLILVPEPPL
jgi:hypothetical protein